jgi:hypothetical protein
MVSNAFIQIEFGVDVSFPIIRAYFHLQSEIGSGKETVYSHSVILYISVKLFINLRQ